MDLHVKVMAQEKHKVKESGFGITSIQVQKIELEREMQEIQQKSIAGRAWWRGKHCREKIHQMIRVILLNQENPLISATIDL